MLNALPVTCLRPYFVKNPRFRYSPTSLEYQRNKVIHWRDFVENYYIEVPCGKCYLCRKKRANGWRIRLLEELKDTPKFTHYGISKYRCIFVCFTFDNEHLPQTENRQEFSKLLKKWRDLWRKKYGVSPRYFAITDKGSQFGRLHLHLLIFNPVYKTREYDPNTGYTFGAYKKPLSISQLSLVNFHWRFGQVRKPTWLESERGISYVSGYMTGSNLTKDATKHGKRICQESLEYIPYIFVSNGLGRGFVESPNLSIDPTTGNYLYRYNGYYYGLPQYYRYKLIDEEFRWHTNLILKKQKEQYLSAVSSPLFSLQGNTYSSISLTYLYNSTFRQFDNKNNKYICLTTTHLNWRNSKCPSTKVLGGNTILPISLHSVLESGHP